MTGLFVAWHLIGRDSMCIVIVENAINMRIAQQKLPQGAKVARR